MNQSQPNSEHFPQSTPPASSQGWWGRNRKWFAPFLIAVVVIAAAGAGYFGYKCVSIKRSDVYRLALEKAKANPELGEVLGQPIEAGLFVRGSIKTDEANFVIPLSGPKGSGTLYVEAVKSADAGEWRFPTLQAAVGGRADKIYIHEPAAAVVVNQTAQPAAGTSAGPGEATEHLPSVSTPFKDGPEISERVEMTEGPIAPAPKVPFRISERDYVPPDAPGTPITERADEPPPPPKPMPTPRKNIIISGGVLNGKAISKPAPAYPPIAKSARASGAVTVQITVDESGRVISAQPVSGHPLLQQAAANAVRNWKFTPTLLSGQPVKVTGQVIVNFTLQ